MSGYHHLGSPYGYVPDVTYGAIGIGDIGRKIGGVGESIKGGAGSITGGVGSFGSRLRGGAGDIFDGIRDVGSGIGSVLSAPFKIVGEAATTAQWLIFAPLLIIMSIVVVVALVMIGRMVKPKKE